MFPDLRRLGQAQLRSGVATGVDVDDLLLEAKCDPTESGRVITRLFGLLRPNDDAEDAEDSEAQERVEEAIDYIVYRVVERAEELNENSDPADIDDVLRTLQGIRLFELHPRRQKEVKSAIEHTLGVLKTYEMVERDAGVAQKACYSSASSASSDNDD